MSAQKQRLNIANEKFSGKKAFGFSMLRLGNILAGLMSGEVVYFATNSLGLAVAAISAGVAVKTVIDALTDLVMGVIVDRTHSRFGKARPWVLAGIPMWLTLLAVFLAPSGLLSGTGLVIYITIFLTLNSAVFSTMANIAYETHIKRCIVKEENRIKTLTIIGVIFAIGSLALQMVLPAIISAFHGSQDGFIIMMMVTGAIGIGACICAFVLCKEYTEEELAEYGGYDVKQAMEKVSLAVFFKGILKNKYLFMFTLIKLLYMMILLSSFNVGQYYFQYVFGNLATFSIVMAMSALMLPIYIFIPKICKKFGVASTIKGTMIIACAGVVLRLVAPKLLPIQCIGYLCASLPNIFIACVGVQISFECMEYGRYKTGMVVEGMYSAFMSFAEKMAGSLSTLLIGLILSVSGFDVLTKAVVENGFADWEELAALGASGFEQYVVGGEEAVNRALTGISFAYNGMPLIFLVICIIIFSFFKLEKDLKKLRVENGLNEDGSAKE